MNHICKVFAHDPADESRSAIFEGLSAAEAVEILDKHISKDLRLQVNGTLSDEESNLFNEWQQRTGKQLTPV